MLLVQLLTTFSKTVSYNTGPGEVNSSPYFIDVKSSTSNLASQQGIIFFNKATDNFDSYTLPDQQEMSEQNILFNVNSADQNTNVHQMNFNSDQSGI